MRKDILARFESELSQSSPRTRNARVAWARRFLEYAEDRPLSKWDKNLYDAFIAKLKREKYSDGTRRFAYGVVKRVVDCAKTVHDSEGRVLMRKHSELISQVDTENPGPSELAQLLKSQNVITMTMAEEGPRWDVGKRSAPKVEKAEKPALTLEEMEAIVRAVREKGDPKMVAFCALASVYGLRREELALIRPEHFKGDTLWMPTVKGGERRDQFLAPELLPFVKRYDFSLHLSLTTLTSLYYKMEYVGGVPHRYGYGYHSIRRRVDTELVDIHGGLKAHIFLRWKMSSSNDMAEHYYSEDPLEIDRKVLGEHPILNLWRE